MVGMDDVLGNWECIYFEKDNAGKMTDLNKCFSTHDNNPNAYVVEQYAGNILGYLPFTIHQ